MDVYLLKISLTLTLVVIQATQSFLAWSEVQKHESFTEDQPSPPSPGNPCNCSVINTVANCSHLGYFTVPDTLPKSITILLLDYNRISRLSSNAFSKYENLTELYIANNTIKHVMDDAFRGLNHLRCLHIEGNNVTCPTKALSILYSLEELYMDGTINMTFDDTFRNLSKLTNLTISGYLGHCKIIHLFNHTFKNVPHLKILKLTFCHLQTIDAGTFLPLRNIHHLDISNNFHLNFTNLKTATYGLQNSSIKILNAGGIVQIESFCNILLLEHTQYLKNTRLEKLYFDYNRLELVGKGVLLNLPPTLWFISARYNKFSYSPYIAEMKHLTSLTHLYLGKAESENIPSMMQTMDENSLKWDLDSNFMCQSWLTPIHEYNRLSQHYSHKSIYIAPNLQCLHFTCGQLHFEIGSMTLTHNNLTTLKLNCNLLSTWIGPVKGLEKLEVLDFSNNVARYVSPHFFNSFPQLKVLNISFNFLGSVWNRANMSHMFDGLTSLEVLEMSLNDIYILPENIFQDLVSVKTLNLSKNVLYLNLPLRVGNMTKLQVLDLSYNEIRMFSPILMNDLDSLTEFNNITIHMIHNPISCTCSNLGFLKWMMASKVHFKDISDYICAFENETFSPMGEFNHTVTRLQQECANHLGLILGSVFAVCLALVIITGGMAYRYRWNLRYWYYAAKLKLKDQSLLDPEDDSFQFDGFISYSNEDEDFVVNEMKHRLETQGGITLNIHKRDFTPGKPIISNILSAIQESRKTVVVLTNNFLESYWCLYELQMANMESIKTRRDVLIIIMYEDIPTRLIPKEVLYHLKTESYIGYPLNGNNDNIDLFWRRLIAAIKSN